ncbi:MAG: cache domain-containing protein [Treponema sp.]|nr:cache domain-containing protein [Treponema sp.]
MADLKDWEKTGKKSISLKAELTGIIIGALALTAAVIVTVSLSILDNNLVLSTEDGLSHTSEGAMYLLEDWQDNVTRYANILASGPDIIASIRNNDSVKADATGEEKSNKFGLDILAIIDSNGGVIGGYGMETNRNLDHLDIIQSALAGEEQYTYDAAGDYTFALLAACPVYINGEIRGCVVAGYDLTGLTESSYVAIIQSNYDVECTVFKDTTRAETTLGPELIGTTLENQAIVNQVFKNGQPYSGNNVINGTSYITNYLPIKDGKDNIKGMLFVAKTTDLIREIKGKTISIVIPVTILIVAILCIAGLFFITRLIRRISSVTNFLGDLASGDADLTRRCDLMRRDEIGDLAYNFNLFMDKLHSIVSTLKESKNELASTGDSLSLSTEETSSSITQIIANISSIHQQIQNQGSSVNKTGSSVTQISDSITNLDNLIESQSASITEASAAVEQMIGNISSVNHSVEKMQTSFKELSSNAETGFKKQQDVSEKINQMEEQSQMLQEANTAISSIAEQTNLLAMNAAIEAAHAGEAGKGFAVVADEIRKLSETSSAQSRTIGDGIDKIRNTIEAVVSSSSESNIALSAVSAKIRDTDQLVMQIGAAMEEQNEGSKQIIEALKDLNNSSVDVHTSSKEMTANSNSIVSEMQTLKEATDIMTTSMDEMSVGAEKINQTGVSLKDISTRVKESIIKIGSEVDLFKV